MIETSSPSTSAANRRVTCLNSASCQSAADARCTGWRSATFAAARKVVDMGTAGASEASIIASGARAHRATKRARPRRARCVGGSQASVRSRPDWLAGSVLELRLPGIRNHFGDGIGQRNVIEIRGELLPIVERPVEELQHLGCVLRLILLHVHEDEACARDGPRVLAWLVGEDLVEAGRAAPVR